MNKYCCWNTGLWLFYGLFYSDFCLTYTNMHTASLCLFVFHRKKYTEYFLSIQLTAWFPVEVVLNLSANHVWCRLFKPIGIGKCSKCSVGCYNLCAGVAFYPLALFLLGRLPSSGKNNNSLSYLLRLSWARKLLCIALDCVLGKFKVILPLSQRTQ